MAPKRGEIWFELRLNVFFFWNIKKIAQELGFGPETPVSDML